MEGNIIKRMAMATAEMETVAKNLKIEAGKNSYKAVSERDVIDAVKKVEEKFGIFSFPVERRVISSEILESEGYDGKKKTTFFVRLEISYRFVNVDDPKDYIEVSSYGDGMDSGDKAPGKAMTYADKYALMKAYKISTGEDPDQEASKEASYTRKNAPKRADTTKTEPKHDRRPIVAEILDFCDENRIPADFITKAYGFNNFQEMPNFVLEDIISKKDNIIEAYKKGGQK